MDRLNFNHLFYFYIVSREGSIKEASEKLHVSQPTISDQIKLLEEYFDCQLFERKNRALHLTDNGKLALQYAEKIFDQARDLTARLRNQIQIPKSCLDIGITHLMGQYFLYERIQKLFDQQSISINFTEGERHYLLADLQEGKLDMVFTDNKEGLFSGLESYRIGINRTFAVGHRKFQKFRKKFPSNLGQIPFFNYTTDSSLKYEIDLFFKRHALSPKVLGSSDDINLLHMVTENGLAFTIVPEAAKNRFLRNPDVLVLGELKEFQTSVYGIIRESYQGIGRDLLNDRP